MIAFDYLIANTDRHWHNFGFIRNVENLQFIGPAPIFDNGTSLWHNKVKITNLDIESRPFRVKHNLQIKLAKNVNFDTEKLKNIGKRFNEILKDNIYIDSKRRETLAQGLDMRVCLLSQELRRERVIER